MGTENRRHERWESRRLARYSFDGGISVRTGATRDFSAGGLCLVTREEISQGTVGVVWLPQGEDVLVPILCVVRNCEPFQVRGNFRLGLQALQPACEDEPYAEDLRRALSGEGVPEGA